MGYPFCWILKRHLVPWLNCLIYECFCLWYTCILCEEIVLWNTQHHCSLEFLDLSGFVSTSHNNGEKAFVISVKFVSWHNNHVTGSDTLVWLYIYMHNYVIMYGYYDLACNSFFLWKWVHSSVVIVWFGQLQRVMLWPWDFKCDMRFWLLVVTWALLVIFHKYCLTADETMMTTDPCKSW